MNIAFADVTAPGDAGCMQIRLPKLLVQLGLATSSTEANRKIGEKAVKLDGEAVVNPLITLPAVPARLVVRLGKRAKIAVIA